MKTKIIVVYIIPIKRPDDRHTLRFLSSIHGKVCCIQD